MPELPYYHFILFLSPVGLLVLFQEHSSMSVHKSGCSAGSSYLLAWLG